MKSPADDKEGFNFIKAFALISSNALDFIVSEANDFMVEYNLNL